jgi:hypothetical protein
MQSSNTAPRMQLHSLDAVQAKVIVLGDEGTGKSAVITNLDSATHAREEMRNDGFFTLIEISPEELEGTTSSVLLKCWEHSRDVSQQEEELAFRAALFCIITLDIRDPDTANSALNKWATLKERLAPECFLFVVGTHLDEASHRRVSLPDICRACAKKDAIYMEVSNSTLVNISLLRKLLKQRLNYMLYRKDAIAHRPFTPAAELHGERSTGTEEGGAQHTEENKSGTEEASPVRRYSQRLHPIGNSAHDSHSQQQHNAPHQHAHQHARNLTVPALEPNILCDSVGSILASHLGTEFWPGLEEEGEELERIGWKIGNFIEQLSTTGVNEAALTTASSALLDDAFSSAQTFQQSAPLPTHLPSPPRSPSRSHAAQYSASSPSRSGQPPVPPAEDYVDAGYSLADLRAAFEIMGLSLPASLDAVAHQETQALDATSRGSKLNASATTYLRKMTVKLPDGTSADMILDLDSNIEQQIELFLLSNSLAEDDEARQKLIGIARKVQRKYAIKEGKPAPPPVAYHSRKDANNSPSDSSASGLGVKHSRGNHLHHIQGSVPFSGGGGTNSGGGSTRGTSPVPMMSLDNVSLSGEGSRGGNGGYSAGAGSGSTGRRVKLRIALGNGATAEVIYRVGESVQAVTEGLATRHQLSREQAQRVYEQLSQATASL